MIFLAAIFTVSTLSGATASLVGFGIGSMLTPLLAEERFRLVVAGAVGLLGVWLLAG